MDLQVGCMQGPAVRVDRLRREVHGCHGLLGTVCTEEHPSCSFRKDMYMIILPALTK